MMRIKTLSIGASQQPSFRDSSRSTNDLILRLEEISKKKGTTMAQTALAWCMQKDGQLLLSY